ncbi:MAG: hypothetical protein ABIP75_09815 [Pyrinomonadaceae bacterium]
MNEPPVTDEMTVDPGGSVFAGSVATSGILADLPVGARLLVQSKTDWRFATVARSNPEKITLTVCSPSGRTYRLRRDPDLKLNLDGPIPIAGNLGSWRSGMARYDLRW